MQKICDREICTGCGLCSNICPAKAITMVESKDTGHFVPLIDVNKCTDCNLCKKSCPSLNLQENTQQLNTTFAAWRTDSEKLKGSSSGGVASAFYETAIANGYTVVGTFLDKKLHAKMACVDKLADCEVFKGSKYVQAKSKTIYSDVLKILKKGQNVLFVGTPCQCAAMRSCAKQYPEKLITVELICHGIPSQKIFFEYISSISKRKKKQVNSVSFRGLHRVELKLEENGHVFWNYPWNEDEYLFSFENNIILNSACYTCRYASKHRYSDITIGDFWGIGADIPFKKPKCMVSVIVVNSEKGKAFLETCDNLILVERTYAEAVAGNPNLQRPSIKPPLYNKFWAIYHKNGIEKAMRVICNNQFKAVRAKNKVIRSSKNTVKKILRY